jgi:hypothetical protein
MPSPQLGEEPKRRADQQASIPFGSLLRLRAGRPGSPGAARQLDMRQNPGPNRRRAESIEINPAGR